MQLGVSHNLWRDTKDKETYTRGIVALPCERLIGAETDIQLICTRAAKFFIHWYICLAKVPGIDSGAAVDDLNDDTGPDAVDIYSTTL